MSGQEKKDPQVVTGHCSEGIKKLKVKWKREAQKESQDKMDTC